MPKHKIRFFLLCFKLLVTQIMTILKNSVLVMFTFQNLYFMILFTHKGLVNNFGHPFLFDPSSSCLVFAFLPSVSQMYFIESSPKPPLLLRFWRTLASTKYSLLWEKDRNIPRLFPKNNLSCWWDTCDLWNHMYLTWGGGHINISAGLYL